MSETIPVTVTYLEMTSRTHLPHCPRPPGKLALLRADKPPVHYYRYLYRLIGDPYNWVSRTMMSDEELSTIISHDRVFIYVLYIDGVPGGFAEIDARHPHIPEIKFFGLSPNFIGRGYGRFFLSQVIDLAWTCGALPTKNYNHPQNGNPQNVLQPEGLGEGQSALATAIDIHNHNNMVDTQVNTQKDNAQKEDEADISQSNTPKSPPIRRAANDSKGGAKRIRLETCTLDHPAALSLYQKLGFSVYDQRKGEVPLLKDIIPFTP